jgi:hypothetical protein
MVDIVIRPSRQPTMLWSVLGYLYWQSSSQQLRQCRIENLWVRQRQPCLFDCWLWHNIASGQQAAHPAQAKTAKASSHGLNKVKMGKKGGSDWDNGWWV